MGDVSNTICVVYRQALDAMGTYTVDPITPTVRYQLREQLLQLEQKEFTDLMKRFSRVPHAHAMTGMLFEAQCQRTFSGQIELVAKSIFRTSDLRSSDASSDEISLNTNPMHTFVYQKREEVGLAEEGVY